MFTEEAYDEDHIFIKSKDCMKGQNQAVTSCKIAKNAYHKSRFKNIKSANDLNQYKIPGVPPKKQI